MQVRHLFEAQAEAEAARSWAALEEVDAIEGEQAIMQEISCTSCPSGVPPMASDSLDVSPSFLPPEQMQLLFEARAEVDAAKFLAALEEAEAKEEEQAIMQEISQASGLIGVTMSSAQDHIDLQMLVSSLSSFSTDAQLISLDAPKAFMDPGQMMHKMPKSDVYLAAKLAQERLFEADECKKQTFWEANVPSPPGSRNLAKEVMEITVHKGQEESKYNQHEQETRLREAELRRRHDMVEAMRDEWNIHRATKHWQITTISAAWVQWQYEHQIRLHQKQGLSATACTARCPSASETPAPIQLQVPSLFCTTLLSYPTPGFGDVMEMLEDVYSENLVPYMNLLRHYSKADF
jgi:predicted GIY-YIG superfamily endonuclease